MKKLSILWIISVLLFGCGSSEEQKMVCDFGTQQVNIIYDDEKEVREISVSSTKTLSKELIAYYPEDQLMDELEMLFGDTYMKGVHTDVSYNKKNGQVMVEFHIVIDELEESVLKKMNLKERNHIDRVKELLYEYMKDHQELSGECEVIR